MQYINEHLRFPGGKAKCLTLSYDDGVQQDARLCELMKKYGIAGTFNISSGAYTPEGHTFEPGRIHRRMTQAEALALYRGEPLFEVATHGYTHPHLESLQSVHIIHQIYSDRQSIEQLYGTICRGHAYPFGTYSQQVMDCLRDCGIVYARTVKSTEKFSLPEDFLQWNPTCHHKNARLMELAEKFLAESGPQTPRLFYLWGHSYEFEEDDNWQVIETFFQQVSGREDVWYATNIQVYDYVQAYHRLVWNLEGDRIYNPTATDVWVRLGRETYCIRAGETLTL